ncbi:MAG: Uma2 family endonuclease [Gemmatimonadaceae bacterium]
MGMPTLRRRWTVTDLEDLPDDGQRYEVIDGELFVTPAPALRHQKAVGLIYQQLADYCRRERVGFPVIAPADVVFSERRGVQPDAFVLPLVDGRSPESVDAHAVLLAIEVLSPSTARADRVVKRTVYREEGVPEYWIIDLDSRTVERSTPADPRVEVLAERIEWQLDPTVPPFTIDLAEYFAEVLER